MKQRFGLFGGSFNPIHNGHLHLVRAVREALQLDCVVLMPAGKAPHKSSAAYAPAEHRLNMCRLAAGTDSWIRVSDFEIRKQGKSYTVETLRALTADYPDIDWTLMIGSDMLLTFDKWFMWQEILRMAGICAVSREAGDLPELFRKAETLQDSVPFAEIRVLRVKPFPVSSSEIREKLRNGADCSCFLSENVVQYIQANHLYQTEQECENNGKIRTE